MLSHEGEPTDLTVSQITGPEPPPRDIRLRAFVDNLAIDRGIDPENARQLQIYADAKLRIGEIIEAGPGKTVAHALHDANGNATHPYVTEPERAAKKTIFFNDYANYIYESKLEPSLPTRVAAREIREFLTVFFD